MGLSHTQRHLLTLAKRETCDDNSGAGYAMWNGNQVRTAKSLSKNGLARLTMIRGGAPFGTVIITDAGRAALDR